MATLCSDGLRWWVVAHWWVSVTTGRQPKRNTKGVQEKRFTKHAQHHRPGFHINSFWLTVVDSKNFTSTFLSTSNEVQLRKRQLEVFFWHKVPLTSVTESIKSSRWRSFDWLKCKLNFDKAPCQDKGFNGGCLYICLFPCKFWKPV